MASVRFVFLVLMVLSAVSMFAMVNAGCAPNSFTYTPTHDGSCKVCQCVDGVYECAKEDGAC